MIVFNYTFISCADSSRTYKLESNGWQASSEKVAFEEIVSLLEAVQIFLNQLLRTDKSSKTMNL